MKKSRIISMILVCCMLVSQVSMISFAANTDLPTRGDAVNAVTNMTVKNGDTDITSSFKENGVIDIKAGDRGKFGNYEITGNTFYYSADITVETDSSTYGTIRLVLGHGTQGDKKRYLEICYRPSTGGNTLVFLNGGGETALYQNGNSSLGTLGDTHRVTVAYRDGDLYFWTGNTLWANALKLPDDFNDFTFEPGFYSQHCTGTISDVEIWGDVVSTAPVEPEIPATQQVPNRGDEPNAADDMSVFNGDVNITPSFRENGVIDIAAGDRGTFRNYEVLGDEFYYAADIKIETDTSTYGTIRLVLGYGMQDGKKRYVEVCYRPSTGGNTIVFLTNTEKAIYNNGSRDLATLGDTHRVTVAYRNGALSFWIDGKLWADALSLSPYFNDFTFEPGFYSQHCTGTISNVEIWGDVKTVPCPEIGDNDNIIKNIAMTDPSSDTTKTADDAYLGYTGTATNRTTFQGITYGDSYNFSAAARFYDNKTMSGGSEVNWEGLVLGAAKAVKESTGEEVQIEIRIRNNGAHIYADETLVQSFHATSFEFGKNYDVVLAYHGDDTISLWADGVNLIGKFDLSANGYKTITPSFYLGGEVCAYAYEDMKLWGDIIAAVPDDLKDDVVLSNTDYTLTYNTTLPSMPDGNTNYAKSAEYKDSTGMTYTVATTIPGIGIEISPESLKATQNGTVSTVFYLNNELYGLIRRTADKGTDFSSLDTLHTNYENATVFRADEEVGYGLTYKTTANDAVGSIMLTVRSSGDKKFTITLSDGGIVVDRFGEIKNYDYPSGVGFTGTRKIAIRTGADYLSFFVDGALCFSIGFSEDSLPVFAITSNDLGVTFTKWSIYRIAAGEDTQTTYERYQVGDINLDDRTNAGDLVRYKKCIAGNAKYEDINTADIYQDEEVNQADLNALVQMFLQDDRGLNPDMEAFHDQSGVYMSTIEPAADEEIEVSIRVSADSVTDAVVEYSADKQTWDTADMHFDRDDETGYYEYFTGTIPGQSANFYYRFRVQNRFTGKEQTVLHVDDPWFCLVNQPSPDWAKGALWYFLMPDAFYNGDLTNDKLNSNTNSINSWNNRHFLLNDFYGGDLAGVSQKTDYLTDLHIDAVYMNPIAKNVQNGGYKVVDHNQVDPAFGNEETVKAVVKKLHESDLKVISDAVLYFSAKDSIYLNQTETNPLEGALQNNPDNAYVQMFQFTGYPNYLTAHDGVLTDFSNPALKDLFYQTQDSVVQRYIKAYGFDGLRFDVGGYLGMEGQDTDTPANITAHNKTVADIRSYLKTTNLDALMLSESEGTRLGETAYDSHWNNHMYNFYETYLADDSTKNASDLKKALKKSLLELPRQQALTVNNFFSNHDHARVDLSSDRGKAALLTQMTYIGSPVIYYGEEIGLERGSRDEVTSADSYYAMDWNEENWDGNLLSLYQSLGQLRQDYTAVKTGAFEEIGCDNTKDLYAFARYDADGAVLTFANGGTDIPNHNVKVSPFGIQDGSILTDYFTGQTYEVRNGYVCIDIPAGGTLLVTGEVKQSASETATMHGEGSFTAAVEGNGVYSVTVGESVEHGPFYRAIVNNGQVYVLAKRSADGSLMKQAQVSLPEGATLKVNRDGKNVFYLSYIQNGTETVLDGSGIEICMPRELQITAKAESAQVSIQKILVEAAELRVLKDTFDTAIPTTMLNRTSGEGICIEDGVLSLTNSASVTATVPQDDWTAETYLQSGKGGLQVVKDKNNYLVIRYTGSSLQFVQVINGSDKMLAKQDATFEGGVYIQISRVGTDYAAYYSSDGTTWQVLGEPWYYNPSHVTVALYADGEACFDYLMYGNGVSTCTPHIFGGDNFAYNENWGEPKYQIQKGTWNYVSEGISATGSKALMSVQNKQFEDFVVNVTLDQGSSGKAGIAFGMGSAESYDGAFLLYREGNTLYLTSGGKTVERAAVDSERVTLEVRNRVATVYSGNTPALCFTATLNGYDGGYLGFFSEGGTAEFKNYYVSAVTDGWIRVQGYGGLSNQDGVNNYDWDKDYYGMVAYRGYAFANGTMHATLYVDKNKNNPDAETYEGGLLLGAAFGKSPEDSGVSIHFEEGTIALRYKGEVVDSCSVSETSVTLKIEVTDGAYRVTVNGASVLTCSAPDCAGGCLALYSRDAETRLYNISVN